MTERLLLSWSGGKDATMGLHRLREEGATVAALVTTVSEDEGLVSGQGVPEALLRAQADSLGLPLDVVYMPEAPSNETYKRRLGARLEALCLEHRTRKVAFADLFLADIRQWREAFLGEIGLSAVFPVWGADTRELLARFLALGYRAWITCVDTGLVAARFAGRRLDAEAVAQMGPEVDPCGERGEYHSFVWDGPGFRHPVYCRPGTERRRGRVVCRPPRAGASGLGDATPGRSGL